MSKQRFCVGRLLAMASNKQLAEETARTLCTSRIYIEPMVNGTFALYTRESEPLDQETAGLLAARLSAAAKSLCYTLLYLGECG